MFQKVSAQVDFPNEELKILSFWKENNIFQKSLRQRAGGDEYVFYDGPPFATGLPHYGHLLAGTIKDVIPRYQTMKGRFVERVFGWDCHGLPVENEMEKELGISSKTEIEEYGIDRFNESCRSIVLRHTAEWERIVHRIGRWVDFERGYRTMDRSYMESVWWVFKTLWDKGLVYEGHKILPYCPRCATPLSNFEANQGYEEVSDPSISVRFQIHGDKDRYLLAWTTTPWTLPSNLAIAVGPDIDYVEVDDGGIRYLLAADRMSVYFPGNEPPDIVARHTGTELAGLTYEPLLPYFAELAEDGAFTVIAADFVSTTDGTGIVHMAPGFGEDDAAACKAHGLPSVCPIDSECRFTSEVETYAGRFVKDCDAEIIKSLKAAGHLIHRSTHRHNYPHCWRCESPLIYCAVSTWFVNIEKIKERMLAANSQIRWVPAHIKEGRFGKWLSNAHDWAISRNRYWGCPLPIWRNEETNEAVCIQTIQELEQRSGRKLDDVHKHFIDDIVMLSASGHELRRVPEVLDCWFESGSMPYAQRHYPFENREWLEGHFPADFIAEGLDQTRGWFYTLVVIGSALFDKPAFKNVIVNGLILAEDGRKMSKRLKNYPDPEEIMNTYGADALRLCLLSTPVVRGEDMRFSENAVKECMRGMLLPLWNAHSFFVTYALVDKWTPARAVVHLRETLTNPLDRWILSQLEATVADVTAAMDAYDLQGAATRFNRCIDNLTNWYIRRSRRRFWKSRNDTDKGNAYSTLHHVLITLCQTASPFIPFITEAIYRNLRSADMPESVHLCDFPEATEIFRDTTLDVQMDRSMTAVSLGRYLRRQAALRVRQPLRSAVLVSMDDDVRRDLESMKDLIADELNVKEVIVRADEEELVYLSAKANFKKLGPRLGKQMKAAAAAIANLDADRINALRAGEAYAIPLDDGDIEVTFDDIEIRREERPGLAVANDGAITVVLDVTLDPELELEGWAREIVNRVQNLRKEADLDVADRIQVYYNVPAALEPAIERFRGYIAGETLATDLIQTSDLDQIDPVALGEHQGYFSVERVG